MANIIEKGMMTQPTKVKGLSFIDWDGLNNEEYHKLSKIINHPNKSSGVQFLYTDEEETDADSAIPDQDMNGEEKISDLSEDVEEIPTYQEKKGVVDVKNSILHPAAPVFQPSVPPPIMPFHIHWHADHSMPPPQPPTAPYTYVPGVPPGSYVFHHDPNLVAHNGEATVAFVTLSNGQPAYAFPGHPIPAHHFQTSGLSSAVPTIHNTGVPSTGHMPRQGEMILHPVPGSVMPTTPSHHHPLLFRPHLASTTMGQPLPAHMIPPHTVSQPLPHNQQQQSTQFMFLPPVSPASSNIDNNRQFCVNGSDSEPVVNSSYKDNHGVENTPPISDEPDKKTDASEQPSCGIEFGGPVVFDTEQSPDVNVPSPSSSNPAPVISSSPAKDSSKLTPVQTQETKSEQKQTIVPDAQSQKKKDGKTVADTSALSIAPCKETVADPSNQKEPSSNSPSSVHNRSSSSSVKDTLQPTFTSSSSQNVNANAIPHQSTVNSPTSNSKSNKTKGSSFQSTPKTSPTEGEKKINPVIPKGEDKQTVKQSPKETVSVVAETISVKPQTQTAATVSTPKSWNSLFGKSNSSVSTPAQSLKSPLGSSDSKEVKSVQFWQEQDRLKEKGKKEALSYVAKKHKVVDVRQDPLASKLLAKLSDFPISHIPIILQPRGLKNGNNICFMNATLQVLMGCPPFIHLFRAFRNLPARSGSNSSTPVFDALVLFVNSFQNCQRRVRSQVGPGKPKKGTEYDINVGVPFVPESLLAIAQDILGFHIGVQQDAEEFLSQILSICNEEVEKIIQMKNMDSFNNNSAGSKNKVVRNGGTHHHNGHLENHWKEEGSEDDGDDSWVQVGPRNHCVETNVNNCGQTPLSAIFAGLSRSCLVRDSGKTSETVDSFFTLKLDIQADSVHSVRDALIRLNATEDVHGVDGRKINGRRRMFFDELPSVLIMHLKLFEYSNGNGQKIQKNISFDVDLQIPKEMLSRVGKPKYPAQKSRTYKLFGVVNHHGTKMNDGHYTSDVFLPIVNGWLHFDDSDVSLSDEASVLQHRDKCMPYLLFYRCLDT